MKANYIAEVAQATFSCFLPNTSSADCAFAIQDRAKQLEANPVTDMDPREALRIAFARWLADFLSEK